MLSFSSNMKNIDTHHILNTARLGYIIMSTLISNIDSLNESEIFTMTQVVTMMRKCYLHIESLKGILNKYYKILCLLLLWSITNIYFHHKREDHGPYRSHEKTVHTIIS